VFRTACSFTDAELDAGRSYKFIISARTDLSITAPTRAFAFTTLVPQIVR
jgi:hypothetical protein